jgi:hypothetical protein
MYQHMNNMKLALDGGFWMEHSSVSGVLRKDNGSGSLAMV